MSPYVTYKRACTYMHSSQRSRIDQGFHRHSAHMRHHAKEPLILPVIVRARPGRQAAAGTAKEVAGTASGKSEREKQSCIGAKKIIQFSPARLLAGLTAC
ncbi:unnamed protein product [Hymenolepis diminuta]|uniref:Uncharacterized protein n=1 Tax=Hymenolepis diminuta TaxID=6216 RepID=A0A0R3S877_HYMDI|nr:unnamed protein product [Hymenolepis diminuta]VUZ50571.1 unnamed protein product [Hymenolepis diminuta]